MCCDRLEQRLKAELRVARAAYDRAKVEFDKSAGLANELGMSSCDGAHALHKASQAYNHALQQYADAVSRFANFILNGVGPQDKASEAESVNGQ